MTARATATRPAPSRPRRWRPGSPATRPAPARHDVLILGDLNSYAKEDPIRRPRGRPGSPTSSTSYLGDDAYSYVFDGQWGYLDHALGSAAGIVSQVTGVAEYHINADEPSVLDYNTDFKSAGRRSPACTRRTSSASRTTTRSSSASRRTRRRSSPRRSTDTSVACGDRQRQPHRRASPTATPTTPTRPPWPGVTARRHHGRPGNQPADADAHLRRRRPVHGDGHRHRQPRARDDDDGRRSPSSTRAVASCRRSGPATTAKVGSTVPVKVAYPDCDGSVPTDLAPVVTVTQGWTTLAHGHRDPRQG